MKKVLQRSPDSLRHVHAWEMCDGGGDSTFNASWNLFTIHLVYHWPATGRPTFWIANYVYMCLRQCALACARVYVRVLFAYTLRKVREFYLLLVHFMYFILLLFFFKSCEAVHRKSGWSTRRGTHVKLKK